MLKRCTKCESERSLEEFPLCKKARDGRGSWCRVCMAAAERARREASPESHRHLSRIRRIEQPERHIYLDMIRRCTRRTRADFCHYGGRGIKVCARWSASFDAFLADMGQRPSPRHSIERIDNDRDYEPENCRWATQKEQTRNTRRTRLITANGRTQCMSAWAEELGAPPRLIQQRIDLLGWTEERAVTEPAPHGARSQRKAS